jgi:uncharacterized protein (DUF983 family)
MSVTPREILQRAVLNRCPNCGGRSLFVSRFELGKSCRDCDLPLERGDGFFLGAMSLNYGVTVCLVLVPITLLWMFDVLPGIWAAILGGVSALLFPILFYRSSRCWWLGFYYLFLPQELPSNQNPKASKEQR